MKVFFVLIFLAYAGLSFAEPVHNESLYQLNVDLTDQQGKSIDLDVYRDHPVLIAMFYARCPHVCPLTIHTIQTLESELNQMERKKLRVLLVTLDPSDTPELLAEVGSKQKVDFSRWTFARANTAGVRKLAAVLGVRFRELPDGEFNHTTLITVLDGNGIPVASSSQLSRVDPGVLAEIRALVQ